MAEGQPSFWDTLKGVASTQASKVLQPLSGTFSTVIGNVSATAQQKVQGIADKLNSTTSPTSGASNVLKTTPSIPDAQAAALQSTRLTIIGLLVAGVLFWLLLRKQ